MSRIALSLLVAVVLQAGSIYSLQHNGVDSTHTDGKQYRVQREVPKACFDVPVTPEAIWEGDYAGEEVPKACQASFVQTVGVLYPISIKEGVETYGELEVLRYLEQMSEHKALLLVDTRGSDWYEYETIPGAVNLWFQVIKKPEVFPEEFAEMLHQIGVNKGDDGEYDFSDASTLLLFCNGPWCAQSPIAILALIEMGYPLEKLRWYRGGMHTWKSLSLTTTLSVE